MKRKLQPVNKERMIIGAIRKVIAFPDNVSVTYFNSPNPELFIVRATKRLYKKEWLGEILVSITKPNARERKFIEVCRKANQPLPRWRCFKKMSSTIPH